ncbi:TonB-dependent receptor [Nitritalea halalkaliphila]|uniref:TonB-dependent receptor n=1 Tax=Nitritalea halalkaliphila TaxID=590849 RepID=UPI001EE65596|nr:TonB-dependent receptor [Nitritalea halalkaliphila]
MGTSVVTRRWQLSGKKWAALSSFTHNRFGDLRMGRRSGRPEYLRPFFVQRIDGEDRLVENPDPLVQHPTGYEQFNFMQKLRYQPHADWDLEYAFHLSETGDFPRYDRLIETQADGSPRSADWRYGPQIWRMQLLSALHQGQNAFYDQLAIRLAHQYFEESRINRNFSGGQRFRLRTNLEEVTALSAQVDAEKSWGRQQLFYGVEYIRNAVSSTGSAIDIRDGSPIAVPDRYPQGTWTSYAAYLNYRWTLQERWVLQAGLRHGGFGIAADFRRQLAFFPFDFEQSNLHNQATTGSAGLIWMPDDSWTLSGTLSTGFRAPNLDDIGKIFDFVGGEVLVPNPSLDAEYAYNAELHASKVVGDWLKLDFTSYYTYLDAAIVRRPFQIAGQDSIRFNDVPSRVLALQNAAFGRVWGFHLGFEALLAKGLTLNTRYNFQRGQEELEDGTVSASRHAAPAFGQSQLRYQNKAFTGILYVQYSAEVPFERLAEEERQKPALYVRDENEQLFSPGWSTWNLKLLWNMAERYQLSAGVENLLDLQYRPYSSGIVAPGRNVTLAFRAHF